MPIKSNGYTQLKLRVNRQNKRVEAEARKAWAKFKSAIRKLIKT